MNTLTPDRHDPLSFSLEREMRRDGFPGRRISGKPSRIGSSSRSLGNLFDSTRLKAREEPSREKGGHISLCRRVA